MNEINDLPGVIAKATLYPGSRPATTGVSIDVLRRPIWNNYLFMIMVVAKVAEDIDMVFIQK